MKRWMRCLLFSILLCTGCAPKPLQAEGSSGISYLVSARSSPVPKEEVYLTANQPLTDVEVLSLQELSGETLCTPPFTFIGFERVDKEEPGYHYVVTFAVNLPLDEENHYHFRGVQLRVKSERETQTVTIAADHRFETLPSSSFVSWLHTEGTFDIGSRHTIRLDDLLPDGSEVLRIEALDERVEVVTDTALPFVKSEQQDAIEIREFRLPSGYDYYSGGLRITYRPGEGEAAIERVLPLDWYAPGGIYQF